MSLKRYIGIIVVILTLIGIVNQQQVNLHNQEIVLQFNDTTQGASVSKATISVLKKELVNLGVTAFKVINNDNGKLKITYYSDAEVSTVKRILLKKIRAELDGSEDDDAPFSLPIEGWDVAYNFDVHEIQNGNGLDTGLKGIGVLEIKSKTDRFFKPENASTENINSITKEDVDTKVAFNCHKHPDFALKNTLQQIPEVRAGPHC